MKESKRSKKKVRRAECGRTFIFNRRFAILTTVYRYSKWPGVGPINPKEEKTGSSLISFETEFLMLILEAEKFQNKFKLK